MGKKDLKKDLNKEALLNEVNGLVEDIKLLFSDYGIDVDECLLDSDSCEEEIDHDLYRVLQNLSGISAIIEDVI